MDPTATRLGLLPSLGAPSKVKPGPSLQPRQRPPSLTHWEGPFFSAPRSQFLTFQTPPSLSSLHLAFPAPFSLLIKVLEIKAGVLMILKWESLGPALPCPDLPLSPEIPKGTRHQGQKSGNTNWALSLRNLLSSGGLSATAGVERRPCL